MTYFTTAYNQVISESVNGVVKDYMTDAIGSVVGYRDASGNIENEYWYKPYGSVLAKTGSGEDPSFMFVGGPGYMEIGRSFATNSVRDRIYDSTTGRWTTPDRLWPSEAAFDYALSSPIGNIDPHGMAVLSADPCLRAAPLPSTSRACDAYGSAVYPVGRISLACFCKCAGDSSWAQEVRGCLACEFRRGTNVVVAHVRCYAAARYTIPAETVVACGTICGDAAKLLSFFPTVMRSFPWPDRISP